MLIALEQRPFPVEQRPHGKRLREISVRLGLVVGRFGCRYLSLFVGVHGEQHVMIKTMFPIVAMPPEIQIDFGALRKPELHLLLCERDRTVLNDLMFAGQTDLGWCLIKMFEACGLATHIKTPADLPPRPGLRPLPAVDGRSPALGTLPGNRQ